MNGSNCFSARSVVALTTLAAVLTSCMRWSGPQPFVPARFAGPDPASEATLFLADGRVLTVHNPFIAHDSVMWAGSPEGAPIAIGHGVPVAQVRSVRVREVNVVGTALLVLAGVGVTAVLVGALSPPTKPAPPPPPPSPPDSLIVSCPLVYSWDGRHWRLDSGTFGGAIMPAFERTDVDNLDFGVMDSGRLRLKVTDEQNETDYLDALTVLAVDHDSGLTVAPDADGGLHTLGNLMGPTRAHDYDGHDVLARVSQTDGWNWESSPVLRDTAVAGNLRDGLELEFARPAGAQTARLVVDANVTPWAAAMMTTLVAAHGRATQPWYDSLAAAPARARALGQALAQQAFLTASLSVNGTWKPQGLVWDAGPEIVKRQVVQLDLTDVTGDTVRVRLESAPSLWLVDHVAIDYSRERPISVTEVAPSDAVDGHGADIRALLGAIDRQPLTLETGDSALLSFEVPATPSGQSRTYLLRATGWYRIHAPADGPPDVALLRRVLNDPNGLAKEATARTNAALVALEQRAE